LGVLRTWVRGVKGEEVVAVGGLEMENLEKELCELRDGRQG